MRTLTLSMICSAALLTGCQEKGGSEEKPAPPASAPASATSALPGAGEIQLAAFKDKEVEVGCGYCIYHMDGVDGCATAAVVDGKHVLVKGAGQDAHSLGLCSDSGRAMVTGAMKGGILVATDLTMKK